MKNNFAALIKVKTIVTFAIIFVFTYLSIAEKQIPETTMAVIVMVVSFYFGTQSDKPKGV